MAISASVRKCSATVGVVLALSFAPLGCKRHRVTVETTEEEGVPLASIVHVADPKAATQLLSGFYGIEQNAWRWTAGRFSVVLRPPRTGAAKGATLKLNFTIPANVITQLKAISLSATINGTALPPESYTVAGQYTYSRDVAPALLTGDSVKVDFALDRTVPPSAADQRELGIVVSSVGFEPK
jgi:hypothetical protein